MTQTDKETPRNDISVISDLDYCKRIAATLRARFGDGVKLYATDDVDRVPRFGVREEKR